MLTISFTRKPPITNLLLAALLLIFMSSCTKNPGPSTEWLADYRFSYTNSNNNKVTMGGEYLKDSIYVQVQNFNLPDDISGYAVEFRIIEGGGTVDQTMLKTRKDGKAATRWKLGTESFKQVAAARIMGPEGKFLPEVRFYAYGMLYNTWNEIDFQPLSQLSDLVSDTIAQMSWMISAGNGYKRGSHFLDWQQIKEPKLQAAREIEIDRNGVIYIGNWNGELYKSADHGQNWIKCANPIPNRYNYFYFWITNDGHLWATVYDSGLWHSGDGGMTWTNPANGTDTKDHIIGVFRLKDGSLLSVSGVKQTLIKSNDNGKTWNSTESPPYLRGLYVTENEDIIVCNYGSMSGYFISSDKGKTFKQVYAVPVAFFSGSMQTNFQKFGSYYYINVPGFGILKTQNFDKFETILSEPNVDGVYLDHSGTIAVKGWRDKLNRSFFYGRK